MPAIGITGGISTGKSSFSKCLRELLPDAGFFDADAAARDLVKSDPEVRGAIEKAFGTEAFLPNGGLNREAIRSIVFADAGKKRALEQILHPRIRRQWSLEAERCRHSTRLFFADIPLLYETGGETLCDRVVVVACSPSVQLERLRQRGASMDTRAPARPGSPNDEAPPELRPPLDQVTAQQMIDAQMPLKEKINRADHVVWNNGGREGLTAQARLLAQLWTEGTKT
ncbi:MAG: dephospho-CoA kinase [Chthoniobacterales bacterium]